MLVLEKTKRPDQRGDIMIYLTSRLYTTWIPKKLRRPDLKPWMALTRNTLVSSAARRIRKQRDVTSPHKTCGSAVGSCQA
jgi:hypothetical protein